jgi:hypothetical protein
MTLFRLPGKRRSLRAFAAESAHGVTGVASLILLADIGDQRLRALYFDFERGDQCIFGVNDDVSGFALNFKADRKLHRCLPLPIYHSTISVAEWSYGGPFVFAYART